MRLAKVTIAVTLGALCWTLPSGARECTVDPASFEADFQAYLGDIYELADEVERKGLPDGISLRELATEADFAARAMTAEQADALCGFFSSHSSLRQTPRSLSSGLRRLPASYDVSTAGRAQARMASENGQSCLGEQGRAAVDLINKTADLAGIVGQAICDAAPSGDLVVVNTVLCPIAGVLKVTAKIAEYVGKVDDICQLFKTTFNLNQVRKDPEWGHKKSVVAWAHPLIESLNLPGVLADQNVPVYVTELKESDADEKFREKERERLRKHIVDSYIGVTSADFCMAETASLVMRTRPGQARSVSLVPSIHIAVIHLDQIIADLKELYALIKWDTDSSQEGLTNCMTFISGPSKTADVEATMVHGAHGPREVYIYVVTDS